MSKCTDKIESLLTALPSSWRKKVAVAICSSSVLALDCEDVRECETLTVLSEFIVTGTEVCISFTDEHGVTVTRCFDFSEVLNNSINNLDPKCLATAEDWVDLDYAGKIQLLIDKVCVDCEEIVNETSSTTSTTTIATTTTSTTAAPTTTTTTVGTTSTTTSTTEDGVDLNDCIEYFVENNTLDDITVDYLRCTGGSFPHSVLAPGMSATYCAVRDTLFADGADITPGDACTLEEPTTTTTTTTLAPTTTTTTIAPTTTTTTTIAEGDIILVNSNGVGNNIVSMTPDVWTTLTSGQYPVGPGASESGTHSGYSGALAITADVNIDSRVEISVNGAFYQCVGQIGTGTQVYNFPSVTFAPTDDVEIMLVSGDVCP